MDIKGLEKYDILSPNSGLNVYTNDKLKKKNFLKDFLFVIKKTDKENWSYFGEEDKLELTRTLLEYGDLTRLIYYENNPIAYIDCYILKKNSSFLMFKDSYKEIGLSMEDLYETHKGRQFNYDRDNYSLYVNVVAVVKKHQGDPRTLKAICFALYDILTTEFSSSGYALKYQGTFPRNVFGVGVTKNGERMCKFMGLDLVSVSYRNYENEKKKRALYQGSTSVLLRKICEILKIEHL